MSQPCQVSKLRPARRRRSKHRFTLVEMVVAMAIMIVVAMLIGTASAAFYNGWRRSHRITERLKMCQAIDRVMDQNVRNLIPFRWRDDNYESRFVFEGKSDSLLFTTLRRTYSDSRGALLFVRLKLEEEELIAEYSSYPRLPWEDENKEEMTREVIARGVRSISFQYAEQDGDDIEFEDYWEEDDHQAVPLAIQLTVEWTDGTREQWLRRTAGSAANQVYGNRQTPL